MEQLKEQARELIDEFKGKNYIYGTGCLERIGELAEPLGKRILLVTSLQKRAPDIYQTILKSLSDSGLETIRIIPSSRPNSPKEDVLKIKEEI